MYMLASIFKHASAVNECGSMYIVCSVLCLRAAYSVTMNIFRKKYFLYKSFEKEE